MLLYIYINLDAVCVNFAGIDPDKLKDLRLHRPRQMLTDVKALVVAGKDLNLASEDGTTLVSITFGQSLEVLEVHVV